MNKNLVLYFSRADENIFDGDIKSIEKGNTEIIAEYIRDIIGADTFKVERKEPYSKDYNTCLLESKEEYNTNARPELAKYLDSLEQYDTIYIGSPIYWGTIPNPLLTQLERLNWQGKKIRVFITHEGNGLGRAYEDITNTCYGANFIGEAIAIFGHEVNDYKEKIEEWIKQGK